MSDDEPKRPRIELSTTQIAGSALAAMSGAFIVSTAGTAGTLIGAAVGSIVATVGAAAYTWSLRRTSAAVRRTAAQVRQTALLTNALPRTVAQGPLRDGEEDPAAQPDSAAASEEPAPGTRRDLLRSLPWGRLALVSLAVMVIGLAGITVIEAITGRPVSSLTGHGSSHGTTLGNAVGGGSAKPDRPTPKSPAPSTGPSQAPAPAPTRPTQGPTAPKPTPSAPPPAATSGPTPSAAPSSLP